MGGMELSEFLLARIAEDEAEAKAQNSSFLRDHGPGALLSELNGYGLHWLVSSVTTASHVLAECDAKRRIVERLVDLGAYLAATGRQLPDMRSALLIDGVVADLALPYADHPDYREEWRV